MKALTICALILFTIDGPLWFTAVQFITTGAIAFALFKQQTKEVKQ